MRKDRHQGEATTSQLGWHPDELPPVLPISNFIKKREENTRGGTRPKLSEKEIKNKDKQKRNNRTGTYGYLNRGKPHRSTKKSC